jgi:hypothetical protein
MLPQKYQNSYFTIDIMLSSSRASRDAKTGIETLKRKLDEDRLFLSEWKIQWAGICAILRAAIHLLQVDAKSCLNGDLCRELEEEWSLIKQDRKAHQIYWEFINKERNAILKEYHWTAYEAYLNDDGEEFHANGGLAATLLTAEASELRIREGSFKGRTAISVLEESQEWVQDRIIAAVSRAGLNLSDKIHFRTWTKASKANEPTIATRERAHEGNNRPTNSDES